MATAEYKLRICEFPDNERPRERLRDHGPEALSDAELLAILLRVGVRGMNVVQLAQLLLHEFNGLRGLQRASFQDLEGRHGMGEAKVSQLKASLEIARRVAMLSIDDRLPIKSPADVAKLLQIEMAHLDQEHLRSVCLDTKNRVQKIHTIYVGSLNSSHVRVGEVFKESLKLNSAAIIVVHNHPSGDPKPSADDIFVTRQIVAAGQLLDVDVLDHLIIGHGTYVSIRERKPGIFNDD